MMIHSLAARALLMMADYGCDSVEAIIWVCRRLPVTMRAYYHRSIVSILAGEVFVEVAR